MTPRAALVVTVSDRSAAGEREDLSGPLLAERLRQAGFDPVEIVVVPDEIEAIQAALRQGIEREIALVATTGGTGFAPRDVTPEATLPLLDKRADGLAEEMRRVSLASTKFALLSRGVCGIARRTLIVNLPGSPKGAVECIEAILPLLSHALRLLRAEGVGDEEHRA